MSDTVKRLSALEKVGYGVGDTASCLFFQTFNIYLMYFYTDVFGLAAASAGTMMMITRSWDTVFDPLVGILADRTQTRWGKFRPYILWTAIPFGVAGILTFSTPNLNPQGKLLYAYITYTAMMMVYSIINTPYSALLGVLTSDTAERTSLSSYRFVLAFVGNFTVQGATLFLVAFLGGSNKALGFRMTMTIYAIIAICLFMLTFLATRERVQPPKGQRTSLWRDLGDLMHNIPWIVLLFVGIFTLIFVSIRGGSIVYYFKYYVHSEKLAAAFMVAGTAATIAGVIVIERISKIINKRITYIWLMIGSAISCATFYLLKPGNIAGMFALYILYSALSGPTIPLVFAMYGDTADYSEWKTGRRATGLVYSAGIMAQKFGWAIGGGLTGVLLGYFGFKANLIQTAYAENGIRLMMSFIPAAFSAIAAIVMFFYHLDEPLMKKIEGELLARRVTE